MKAVNLIPEGGGRAGGGRAAIAFTPAYGIVALLVVALGMVTMYVLSSNTVASRKAQLAQLQQETSAAQAQANQLTGYVSYEKLAQARIATVRQITQTRFDWQAALSNLSRVVPANTAFQSLLATAAPGSSVSGGGGSVGGAGTGGLRGDIPVPAFEVKGCSASHDDVARLISRLRAMPGVQRVTLTDSVKTEATGSGGAPSTTSTPAGRLTSACGRSPAGFDLVVFFQALPGGSAAGAVATGTPPATPSSTTPSSAAPSSAAPSSATPAPTTPAGGVAAANGAGATTTSSTSAGASAQPVSTGSTH